MSRGRLSSIRVKLILAFMLVSVVPMLVATEIATEIVARTFENNLRVWLFETSRFFFGNLLDERREALGIVDNLIEDGTLSRVIGDPAAPLPPAAQKLMDALGYDLLVVYDASGRMIFTSRPVDDLASAPIGGQASLYRVRVDGQPMLMAGAARTFAQDGTNYQVLLGLFIDQNYISNINALKSFEMRLYYRQGNELREFYSSSGDARPARPLGDGIVSRLAAGEPYIFRRGVEGGRFLGVYSPLKDSTGHLIAVIFSGLRNDEGLAGWLNRTNIFVAIFIVGSALAVLGGLLMSRQLTRPLLRLVNGVRAVAAGDFSHRVSVTGRDEVADLALAYNAMAGDLERLRDVEARLRRQERLSTLGEVAAGLAHEIRNPLGIIKTTAELLQRSPRLDPADVRRLGYVAEEVRRIDSLIRDFLAFARPPQVFLPIRLAEIAERVIDFTGQEAESRGVDVSFSDRSRGAQVEGDPGQIYDAVLNLVLNALDAVPRGGALRLELAMRGADLVLVVADTGPGVPEEVRPKLFVPFVTSKPEGTGLGLAKVFAVMEAHGGRVDYKGDGRGAVFELVFPQRLHAEDNVA
ncbi:MAG: ATP-binding protein [Alsobacter sp.]